MKFTQELPIWLASGVKPPESLINNGWKASQKPPADYFNWFFYRTHEALKELQEKSTHIEDFDNHKSNNNNPHGVTANQVGLGNVLNQKQATKVEFDAHTQNNTKHVTEEERTFWNEKAEAVHNQSWNTITDVPEATITKKGIVKLTDSITSTDVYTAATPNSVKNVNDELENHKSNNNNPHGVTASQVGTYSSGEIDKKFIPKTQYTNDLGKKIDKTAFNAVGQHISYNGITIHIQKSNTIITCNVEGIFKKGKANGWHGVTTYVEAGYRPVNMIIKVPLTINIGNTIQTNKHASIQIETSGRIMIRVYGLQNDDVEFGGSATWIR
ncbi:phage tail protein [Enterococcus faecalis]|uniref:phage tail protein n=1 Tax=Enterococcus faecalis TaxID=1351 RepID=UPI001E30F3EE|nr:tail fiber protein [Enterococcus faecalis]MCD5030865.1 tail fiber protein [Enterococcus faecalis]